MSQIHLAIPAVGAYRKWAEVCARSATFARDEVVVHYLDWSNCDRAKLEKLGSWHGSAIAWSRLFLSEILPREVEWVISADADVLFRGDAGKLMEEVLNAEAQRNGGTQSPVVWMSGDSQPPWRKYHPDVEKWLGAHPEIEAGEILCSGLTVIDLKRWREEGWQKKVDAFLEKYPDAPFLDQMALNVVCKDVKAKLPPQWGCFSGDTNAEVDYDGDCAIHYVGDAPWERKGATRLLSDAVVLWREAAGLKTGGWRRWAWLALRSTRCLWAWEPHMAWHFRTALKRGKRHFRVNGMLVVDRLLRAHGLLSADEVWVHGMWLPRYWVACLKAKMRGKTLVRMMHGSLDPVRLGYSKWKKRLVKPIEKFLYRMADKIVFTGPWEAEWFKAWMKGQEAKFEIVDLKRFFRLDASAGLASSSSGASAEYSASLARTRQDRPSHQLHVLYLGRRHPLKGVGYLEKAVEGLNVELRIVSDHTGEELERDWAWCDVLCLPTLSENFGLVVAEALERGKRVITTDGAPAWRGQPGVVYLKGYREGSDATRVGLLADALARFL